MLPPHPHFSAGFCLLHPPPSLICWSPSPLGLILIPNLVPEHSQNCPGTIPMRHHFSSKMYSSPVLLPSQYRALTFPFWLFGNDIFIYLPAQAMGMFFRRDVVVRSRFPEFQAAMRSAFLKVRDDVSLAAQWIQYLHAELEGQKGRHNDAGRRMDSLSSQLAA